MIQLVYSRRALVDLERLTTFLLEADADAAPAAVRAIVDGLRILERHPFIGCKVRGALRELVISFGATGYVALYRVSASRVEVLAVRHQREAGTRL